MLKFLKAVRVLFWGALVVIVTSTATAFAVLKNNSIPSWDQIDNANNISQATLYETRKTVKKSRASAVMVRSATLNIFSGVSSMSGTYFIAKGQPYVLTANHGIRGPCWLVAVVHEEKSYPCKKIMASDESGDYTIILLGSKIDGATAVKIPQDLPNGSQWKQSYSILNKIIYTGYPNLIGPLTLRGDVVGYTQQEQIYVFSHAYGGASGSGVFSVDGKYIGHVVAIDVGSTEIGVDVLENIVIVTPAFNIDWRVVLD